MTDDCVLVKSEEIRMAPGHLRLPGAAFRRDYSNHYYAWLAQLEHPIQQRVLLR